jgi:ABC-type bacteriocin/lantibiotic exporter with double-glycine peptidase domain
MGFQRQRAIKVTRAEPPDFAVRPANANRESATQLETLIATHDLTFRYHERGEPVLRGCSMRIDAGDRLLLEGESGGGKSTLASLLTGLLAPESGLLLLGGLDRQTIGLRVGASASDRRRSFTKTTC